MAVTCKVAVNTDQSGPRSAELCLRPGVESYDLPTGADPTAWMEEAIALKSALRVPGIADLVARPEDSSRWLVGRFGNTVVGGGCVCCFVKMYFDDGDRRGCPVPVRWKQCGRWLVGGGKHDVSFILFCWGRMDRGSKVLVVFGG